MTTSQLCKQAEISFLSSPNWEKKINCLKGKYQIFWVGTLFPNLGKILALKMSSEAIMSFNSALLSQTPFYD